MDINKKIKGVRELKGFTRQNMAEKLNIGYSTYSNYENGKRRIPLSVLLEISDLLDIDINFFLQSEFDDYSEWETNKILTNPHTSERIINQYKELHKLLQSDLDKMTSHSDEANKNKPSKFALDKISEYYNKLNADGKKEATKRVEELTYIPKYTNKE